MKAARLGTRLLTAVSLIVATAVVVATSSASTRHLALSRSLPMKDSTVTVAPTMVQLWFTEAVKAPVTNVRVVGSDSVVVATDPVTVGATAKDPVNAKFKAPLKPGRYKVMWRTVGSDSHAINGEFTFTYKAGLQ